MNTYRVKVKQVYIETMFIEAESEDEANEKLLANVNSFEDVEDWIEEWELAETELKEVHQKYWVDLPPRTNVRQK